MPSAGPTIPVRPGARPTNVNALRNSRTATLPGLVPIPATPVALPFPFPIHSARAIPVPRGQPRLQVTCQRGALSLTRGATPPALLLPTYAAALARLAPARHGRQR